MLQKYNLKGARILIASILHIFWAPFKNIELNAVITEKNWIIMQS